jgi:alkyl hydroperoxide reductase subunit AhpC
VIPSLRDWYEDYGDRGLVIIGNHYPEFSYERDLDQLKDALLRLNVPYPVLQDNNGENWKGYDVHYWPTLVLVDKKGQIRLRWIGEGRYDEIERALQTLLAEEVEQE